MEIKQLFRLGFLEEHTNVVFVGSVGLGKTHLAVALGQTACEAGHEVLFVSAVAMILDEVGYLPIDKTGADLMFEVLAARYEKASTILTTNRAYKHWPEIFNNDATLTAALLDRLVHHVCTVVIEGRSYRTKDQITPP